MAQQYNPKRVIRQTDNALLKTYFEQEGVPLNVAWDEIGPQTVEPIFEEFLRLPEGDRKRIEPTLHDVHTMAAGDWIKVIIEEAERQGEDVVSVFDGMASRYDKALWTCMNKPKIWKAAVKFAHADGLVRYWDRRGDVPSVSPDVSEDALRELEATISAFFVEQQGRGRHCRVEHLKRGEQDYFFVYLSDYPDTYDTWDDNDNLVSRVEQHAFELVICYDQGPGTLDICTKGGKKVREPIQDIFARVILDEDLPPEDGSKRLFNLDGLLDRNFDFHFDPADGIRAVSIRSMRVCVIGNPRHKHQIDVDPEEGPQAIWDGLETEINAENLPLSVLRPDYVKIHFDLDNNGHGRSMTFEVRSRSCTLKSKREEQRLLGEKYLREWGMDLSA